jgi:regulator of RNase E activity RraB|tara:strand:+ start:2928 stop:3503 length:576 start_codon:yes stop_codon:yes gene_type:complete
MEPTMKTFKQYLTESTKEHKFTLRFCCDLDETQENRIETFLSKYDLKTMSKTSTTPITKNPMFFKDVENSKVSKIDVVTGYPLSADILQQQLSDLLGLSLTSVVVHPDGWEPEVEEDNTDKEALLASDYDETSDDGKSYGKTFVDKFLNDLEKKEHDVVENELSVKPKSDPAPEQMSKDEQSSASVISGDE